jgi:hypothetical protein
MQQPIEKKFKLVRIMLKEEETPLTSNLLQLRQEMEEQQIKYPNDDFKIVDQDGCLAELADFLESELAHPVAKANRVKEEKKEQYKKEVIKRLKRC